MKTKHIKISVFLIFLFAGCAMFGQNSNSSFFIKSEGVDDNDGKKATTCADYFEAKITSELMKKYPCSSISSVSNVSKAIEWDRMRCLMTSSIDNNLEDISKSLGARYIISIKVKTTNADNKVFLDVRCVDSKKIQTIANETAIVNGGDDALDEIEKMSKKLVDDLKKIEICPFIGDVNLSVEEKQDTVFTEKYTVYCNNTDQQYSKKTEIHRLVKSEWKLYRQGISWTKGDMNFTMNESSNIEEINPCYTCKSGREGGRSSNNYTKFNVSGSGISHQSKRDFKPQDDTRIELKFLDNDQYIITVKGTSNLATGNEISKINSEGTCDNESKNESKPKTVSIPIRVVFGPYNGSTDNNELIQSDTQTVNLPSGGTQKITINFNLKKK